MNIVRKLTFLLIILALAVPVMASAADMSNCPHMSESADGDIPCHSDQDAQKDDTVNVQNDDMANMDGDCGDECDGCQCMSTCSVFLTPEVKTGSYHKGVVRTFYSKSFKDISPESLRHPPISIS